MYACWKPTRFSTRLAAYRRSPDTLPCLPQTQGGGNCANALTAAARLGLAPALVTKIGGDALGDQILAELDGDGVDTAHVLRAASAPSPFTYIIVDRQGAARSIAALVPCSQDCSLLPSAKGMLHDP